MEDTAKGKMKSYLWLREVIKRRVRKLIIKDDIKAINKDIVEAKDWEQMVQRASYWIVKLKNIYPDYEFKTYVKPLHDKNIIFIDYEVKRGLLKCKTCLNAS